jgi:hypothetical protein
LKALQEQRDALIVVSDGERRGEKREKRREERERREREERKKEV